MYSDLMSTEQVNAYLERIAELIEAKALDVKQAAEIVRNSKITK